MHWSTIQFSSAWTAACQASLPITNSWRLLKLMSIELVMLFNHVNLCRSLRLLPSVFPSIRVFSNESVLCIKWPKYWNFSFSVSPSNEDSGLISFRIDWFDLLAIQGTLKSLLQHHSSKASVFLCSAFFIVQPSHPYMTTGKIIVWLDRPLLAKVMSLLFNMLSRLVIVFLPRSKCLLISWLQSSSAVILEPKKIKSLTVSIVSPSICHEVMGPQMPWSLFSECWILCQLFHSPLSFASRGSLVPLACSFYLIFIDYCLSLTVVFTKDSEISQKALKDISFLHTIHKSRECEVMHCVCCYLLMSIYCGEIQGRDTWNKMKAFRRCLLLAEFQAIARLQGKQCWRLFFCCWLTLLY